MDQQVVRIKCPWCSSVLSVKMLPGIENKSVNCPVCKHKSPFTQFQQVTVGSTSQPRPQQPQRDDSTNYGGGIPPLGGGAPGAFGADKTAYGPSGGGTTELPPLADDRIGYLEVPSTGESFRLLPGRNIIGRKAKQSNANIQINTAEKMISREHFVIDVQSSPTKGNVHIISLAKEQVNPTFVGSNRLEYKDALLLNSGDIVRLPGNVVVRFVTK